MDVPVTEELFFSTYGDHAYAWSTVQSGAVGVYNW